jgi:pimeloyl-ACP methyl ester carboxylesterase
MGIPLKKARPIRFDERDVQLRLDEPKWPPKGMAGPNTWAAQPDLGLLKRRVGQDENKRDLAIQLKERVLRFPSAPIHGLHRLSQEHVNMGPVERFHTLRLLSHPTSTRKVSRIFLMHNGLNETQRMGLYYQLASYLIEQDPGTVCLLRPFPGHLTRCASPGLTETPLDHYLWDGLHLFRQFLRHMIETRWLLSTIARYSWYHCVSGSGLLNQSDDLDTSRLRPGLLASAMRKEWVDLHGASKQAIKDRKERSPAMGRPPTLKAFRQSIDSLQDALGLGRFPESDGKVFVPGSEPELHAIGYSLGGFAAQSVFMSWPFLVSSCSTLLSGGAMRELAPTSFADPEEWQTVLHSLRYELDDALMDERFNQANKEGPVMGIDPNLFLFLKRTFYEVFQQEYRGSFQTRLVAFRQRMLFVVGGNDPIVRPQSVLDSSPPDGINMIAVGGLGHFLEGSPEGQVEKEQRSFWMPEIGQTIGRLATEAAKKHRADLHDTWLDKDDLLPVTAEEVEEDEAEESVDAPVNQDVEIDEGRLSVAERLKVQRDGTLSNLLFQRSLDDLLARAKPHKGPSEGFLFILKNEVPTFLLGERALHQHAAALYHEDVGIADYIKEVRARRRLMKKARERIWVVLPWNVETIMHKIDAGREHPSQSESSGEQMAVPHDAKDAWGDFVETSSKWTTHPHEQSVRIFPGPRRDNLGGDDPEHKLELLTAVARERLGIDDRKREITPALPDCWVWLSNRFFGSSEEDTLTIQLARRRLCEKVQPLVLKGKTDAEREKAEDEIAERLRRDDLRIITLSRARYNPRFRGRIIAEPRQAQDLLLQAALCIATSVPFGEFDFRRKRVRTPRR